jgi:hypothetical protein
VMNYMGLSLVLILTPFLFYTFYKHQQFVKKYQLK